MRIIDYIDIFLRGPIIVFGILIFSLVLYIVSKSWELFLYLRRVGKIKPGVLLKHSYYFNEVDCEDLIVSQIKIRIQYLYKLLKTILLIFVLSTSFLLSLALYLKDKQ